MGTTTNLTNSNGKGQQNLVNDHKSSNSVIDSANTEQVIPSLPIYIDQNDIFSGARLVCQQIRPLWNLDFVELKLFTDGITNKLVGCFNNESNLAEKDVLNNVVLVRIYGNKTDLLIDRNAETKNIKLLHTYGFAPSLFATFKNGLAYEYVPGVTLTPLTVIQPDIWKMVARRMAEMHKVPTSNNNNNDFVVPMLWEKMQQMLNLVPEKFNDPEKQARLEKLFLPVQRIRSEFEYLYRCLEKLDSPIVFAHNDLLLGNVIYTESEKKVTFIDFEYAAHNFQAFDIGNHFAEFAGVGTVDFSNYPKKEFQVEWLKVYLRHYLEKDIVDDNEIERLYVQVNQFSLASHLFWVVWALIQAHHSNLDFDFIEYAQLRYAEYVKRKEEFLSMTLPIAE